MEFLHKQNKNFVDRRHGDESGEKIPPQLVIVIPLPIFAWNVPAMQPGDMGDIPVSLLASTIRKQKAKPMQRDVTKSTNASSITSKIPGNLSLFYK